MISRKRFVAPTQAGDWPTDRANILKAVAEYLNSLQAPGALSLTKTPINSSPIGQDDPDTGAFTTLAASGLISANGGQVAFPTTQVPSADPNTLDDYEEVTAQALTVTSGTGTLTSANGTIDYTKVGREIFWQATLNIVTNGTGATDIRFTFPFTVAGIAPFMGFETGVFGVGLVGYINGTTALCYLYNSGYPGANGAALRLRGVARV